MKWWQKIIFYLTLGFIWGYIFKDNLSKPDEVTNIDNDIKVKGNKAPIEVNNEPVIEPDKTRKEKRVEKKAKRVDKREAKQHKRDL